LHKSPIKVPFYNQFSLHSTASAVPQTLNRAELARVASVRAESRAIVAGFSARITALARQATPTLDATQIALIDQILKEVEKLLAQAVAGTLTDLALLQLLVDIASTIVPSTTTTPYVCPRFRTFETIG
jgi:hypothetical protein